MLVRAQSPLPRRAPEKHFAFRRLSALYGGLVGNQPCGGEARRRLRLRYLWWYLVVSHGSGGSKRNTHKGSVRR
jgi:hypothetical protein